MRRVQYGPSRRSWACLAGEGGDRREEHEGARLHPKLTEDLVQLDGGACLRLQHAPQPSACLVTQQPVIENPGAMEEVAGRHPLCVLLHQVAHVAS